MHSKCPGVFPSLFLPLPTRPLLGQLSLCSKTADKMTVVVNYARPRSQTALSGVTVLVTYISPVNSRYE